MGEKDREWTETISPEDTPRGKLPSRDLKGSIKTDHQSDGGPDLSARSPRSLPSRLSSFQRPSSFLPPVTMSLKIISSSTLRVRPDAINNLNGGSFQQDALCTRKGRSRSSPFSPRFSFLLQELSSLPPPRRPNELTCMFFSSPVRPWVEQVSSTSHSTKIHRRSLEFGTSAWDDESWLELTRSILGRSSSSRTTVKKKTTVTMSVLKRSKSSVFGDLPSSGVVRSRTHLSIFVVLSSTDHLLGNLFSRRVPSLQLRQPRYSSHLPSCSCRSDDEPNERGVVDSQLFPGFERSPRIGECREVCL